jgi:hypothetical protein
MAETEQTLEEIEAETARIEELLRQRKLKQAKKNRPEKAPLARIQQDQSVKGAGVSATLKNSHGGYAGRTIINRIEEQMDKRRKVMEDLVVKHGEVIIASRQAGKTTEAFEYQLNRGRYEGLAAALAILRSSSVAQEVSRSNERLDIS